MAACSECGGKLVRIPELPYSHICENLAAKAVERWKAGNRAPVTHADLRQGIKASPMLERIEGRCREIGKLIGGQMPEGYGFLLAIFRFTGEEFTWISNAQREDMVRCLREFLNSDQKDEPVTVPKAKLMDTLAYCWVRGWYAGQDGAKTDEGKIHAAEEEFRKLMGLREDAP